MAGNRKNDGTRTGGSHQIKRRLRRIQRTIMQFVERYSKQMILGAAGLLVVLVIIGVVLAMGGHAPADSAASSDASSTAWSEPEADADYDASAGVIDVTAYSGTVLTETKDQGAEYVAETLFLGDSNTYRYMMYADEKTGQAFTSTANNIGVVSMGVSSITGLKCEQFVGDSGSYTMPQAVAKLKPRRIIIGFGTNNLSGSSTDASNFITSYKKGLAAIHEAYPAAVIIVNSIPPLDKQRENTSLNQSQVDAYNAAILEMCEEEDYKYLNSAEVLKDSKTGWAKTDYTLSDGVHLSKTAVTELFTYIRTHADMSEDARPTPLGKIPTPSGVIPNLINADPIAVRGAKYPIEVNVEGGGKASAGSSSAKAGTSVSLTATADEGWEFSHWAASAGSISGGASATLTMPSTVDANGVVVTAYFTETGEKEYTIKVKYTSGDGELGSAEFTGKAGANVYAPDTINANGKTYVRSSSASVPDNGGEVSISYSVKVTATAVPTVTQAPVTSTTAPTAPTAAPTTAPTAAPVETPVPEPTQAPTEAPPAEPTPAPPAEPTVAPPAEPTTPQEGEPAAQTAETGETQ